MNVQHKTDFNVQVKEGHYAKGSYNNLERFISYYYQISSVLGFKDVRSVLEIGPGSKLVARELAAHGIQVTTADFDNHVQPDVVADIRNLPFKDGEFNLSMACQVIEHIPFSDFEKALTELSRVSSKYVVISLPQRTSYLEVVLRLPGVRTIFKKSFLDFAIAFPLRFPGFESSRQHYWEIDRGLTPLPLVKKVILKHFEIVKEFNPVLNKYHHFFVLKKHSL